MFTAMQNVVPSHLVDSDLFDFKGVKTTGDIVEHGDIGFDEPEFKSVHSSEDEKTPTQVISIT